MAEKTGTTRLCGRYELGDLLGRGGMAEVFAAGDLRLGRPVAVKMLRPELSAEASVRARFEKEARTAARLSHPNVVAIFDTGEEGERPFIVMERLPGTTLEDELSGGPLPLGRTRDVAAQLLAALEAAHAAGVIHRDVKPGNVLTCPDGRVKIGDFGIAVALSDARQTSGNLVLGTPAYLAPERIAGKPASPAADLYSLGAVLYRCLTGKRPREGANTVRILAAMAMQRAQPVMELRPEVDRALAAAVDRALDPDPAMRPGSASEMLAMLEGRSQPAGSWRTASRPARHMRAPGAEATATLRLPLLSRRRRIPFLVCAAALVSAGLLIPLSLGPSHVTHRPGRNGAAVTAGENLRGVPQPLRKALGRLDRSISKP